jgi:hypothetical protein
VVRCARLLLSPHRAGGSLSRFGRFDLDAVVERLRAFGQAYDGAGDPARYVVAGDALLNEQRVLAVPSLPAEITARHGRLITVDLPLSAPAILARSNLRVMGLGPNGDRCARVQMRHGQTSIRREVRARQIALGLGLRSLVVPAVLARGQGWVVDQQVGGHHAREPEMLRFIQTALPAFHAGTVRMRPFRGPYALGALVADVKGFAGEFTPSAANGAWPVALCHGDIAPTNLLCTEGGSFALVDWERARVMAVAFDFARVCIEFPATAAPAIQALRRMTGKSGVAPEVQLAIGLACERRRQIAMPAADAALFRRRLATAEHLMRVLVSGALV